MFDVVVIAGTSDARQIIGKLLDKKIRVAATVTTSFGSELLNGCLGLSVFEGKLSREGMSGLLAQTGAKCLIDASHPFAQEASINAVSACNSNGIPYLRFERETDTVENADIIRVVDYIKAAECAAGMKGNILLTIGSNNIEFFTERIADFKKRLYVRILPVSAMLARCEAAGLTADNIIAAKGPFSETMNIEMIKYCKAEILVTKDSGKEGGVAEKLSAAQKTGTKAILIERPVIDYINKVSSIQEAVGFAERLLLQDGTVV